MLVSVSASAPASSAASATSRRSEVFGESLAQRRPAAGGGGLQRGGGRHRRVGEHAAAVLEVGTAHVHLDGDEALRRVRQERGRPGELLDPAAPDARHDAGARARPAPEARRRAKPRRRVPADRRRSACRRGPGRRAGSGSRATDRSDSDFTTTAPMAERSK